MVGFIVALFYFIWRLLSGILFETAFLSATYFLFWWYFAWIIFFILLALGVIILVMIAEIMTEIGFKEKLYLIYTTFIDLMEFKTVSAPFVLKTLFRSSLFIFGSFILNHSVFLKNGAYAVDYLWLIVGSIIFFLGLVSRTWLFYKFSIFVKGLYLNDF